MQPVVYYRRSLMDKNELAAIQTHFRAAELLTDIGAGELVIPRYSIVPYAYDQLREISNIGATAINSYRQHEYVADLGNYVRDLGELTPTTWRNLHELPDNTAFVLKGMTNSKKQRWDEMMFAADKQAATKVHGHLCDDSLISEQQIYIRQFEPMITYMTGIGGCPITREFRFFVAYSQVLCGAYYWQNYVDDLPSVPSADEVPREFLQEVINRVGDQCNFYVIDVGQKANGDWMVVELNDGCQSGLSCNDPNVLYGELKRVLMERGIS